MKIIILGANEVSNLLIAQFSDKNDITIINNEETDINESFKHFDIDCVYGNGANIDILKKAKIEKAQLFIACTSNDEANIVSCLTVKSLSNARTVCFASRQDYIDSLNLIKNCEIGMKNFIIDKIIWPENLLTQEIFRIITTPLAIKVEDFSMGKARLTEYRINNNSKLLNKKIKDCAFPDETLIVGITREDRLFIPNGETILKLNDKVIFMGQAQSLDILAFNFFENTKKIANAIIIGGGTVGFMLAKNLEKLNIETKIIEADFKRCEYLSEKLENTLVLHGDGTDFELLRNEDVSQSDVLISVTNNDEKNLLCSLLARQSGAKKVISRVSKSANLKLFEKVGVDVAVSTKSAAVNEIKHSIVEADRGILSTVEMGQGEILKITLNEKFKDIQLKDLKIPKNTIVAIIERARKVIIPKGITLIRPCDALIIFTTYENSSRVKEFFEAL